jgi:hypothetical protein
MGCSTLAAPPGGIVRWFMRNSETKPRCRLFLTWFLGTGRGRSVLLQAV